MAFTSDQVSKKIEEKLCVKLPNLFVELFGEIGFDFGDEVGFLSGGEFYFFHEAFLCLC